MAIELDAREARIIGCLMEKSVITPEQYPMTLNALTNACNQKSSREPVMNLTQTEVQQTLRQLESKHLVRTEENFKSQVEKFTHRLCNTPFSKFQFDPAQFAIMTVLLLRGPRTPGELRANVGRLHSFADNSEVEQVLESLTALEEGAVVRQLPRTPGRRDSEYVHLLGNSELPEAETAEAAQDQPVAAASQMIAQAAEASLSERVNELEQEMARLRAEVATLRGQISDQS